MGKWIAFLAVIVTASTAGAQDYSASPLNEAHDATWAQERIAQILTQVARPTMADVREVAHYIPEDFGNSGGGRLRFPMARWPNISATSLAQMIAALEWAYPGGTFAFLGRDSMALADAVEGFYLSIRQTDRVRRIGASKATFTDSDVREKFLYLLRDLGLDVWHLDRLEHPFIFVDTISTNYGTQSRSLVDYVYTEYEKRGGDPRNLVQKVNALGMTVSTTTQTDRSLTYADKEKYFASEKERLQSLLERRQHAQGRRETPPSYKDEHRLMLFPRMPGEANEVGYDHFTPAWHESYESMYWVDFAQRKVRPVPGSALAPEVRRASLWYQKQTWNRVSSPEFQRQVAVAALQLGYRFPRARPSGDHPLLQIASDELVVQSERLQLDLGRAFDEATQFARSYRVESPVRAIFGSLSRLKSDQSRERPPNEISENVERFIEGARGKLFNYACTHPQQLLVELIESFSRDEVREKFLPADLQYMLAFLLEYTQPSTLVAEALYHLSLSWKGAGWILDPFSAPWMQSSVRVRNQISLLRSFWISRGYVAGGQGAAAGGIASSCESDLTAPQIPRSDGEFIL